MARLCTKWFKSRTVRLCCCGRMDRGLVFELTELLSHDSQRLDAYEIDMKRVSVASDSGLAALLMFCRRVRRMGGEVNITGCPENIRPRLVEIGLLPSVVQLYPLAQV